MEPHFHYEIKFLKPQHLPEILTLQNLVIENLPDKECYYQEPLAFFEKVLADGKNCLGLFEAGDLIGFHMACLLEGNEAIGADIGLGGSEVSPIVQWGPTAIHPKYRQQGLLKMLADHHLKIFRDRGYEHICLTIAPQNYASLSSAIRQGFLIKRLTYKFGHLLRYVLHLELKRPCKAPVCQVRVTGSDLESQQFLLSLGFYGSGVLRNQAETELLFGHDGFTDDSFRKSVVRRQCS